MKALVTAGLKRRVPVPPEKQFLILLLAWSFVTAFSRVGEAPVYIENEAREGIYIRAMLDTGNYILPEVPDHVECGETIPDKPPLFHWIGASAAVARHWLVSGRLGERAQLSQAVNEWIVRFPSAVISILTVLAMVTAAPRVVGTRAAFLAAACLLTSWQFIHQSHYGRVDMALAGFTTWTMLLLGRALLESRRWPFAAAAVASGLAVLSKGPLGLVLPVLGVGDDPSMLLLVYFPDWSRITIVPHREPLLRPFAPGYYLFSGPAWETVTRGPDAIAERWQVLWSDELRERGKNTALVMARKLP